MGWKSYNAARLVGATHPDNEKATAQIRRNLRIGVSPRGIQALFMAAKVEALLDNRKAVAIEDIRQVVYPALRHRLFLTYEAQAEGVREDALLDEVLRAVPG
jgi:MoxR-like ATPase